MNLVEADISTIIKVKKIDVNEDLKRRFYDLGIIEDTIIEVLYRAPFGDPTAYLIRGSIMAIRKEESEKIEVIAV